MITFDYRWLFLPLGVAGFLVVWMTSHAINLLILLCPFSIVDLGLKFFKVLIVTVLMLSYVINPILGALISLGLIAFTAYLAPKVFRFSYFVTLLSFDLITPWRSKKTSQPDNAHAFLADGSLGAPRHTYGRIKKTSEGIMIFRYRPKLIMKARTIELRAENRVIRKGMLYPVILQTRPGHEKLKSAIILPPRYRRIEHLVAENFEINDVREGAVVKGFQGAKIWIKDLFQIRSKKQYSPQC
jgi:hypothetical protein